MTHSTPLRMQSQDSTRANLEVLAKLFPQCFVETRDENGTLRHQVDFDKLRQELSDHVVDGPAERYQSTWPGKREAVLLGNAPITKTLRPCPQESVNYESTQNLYIEGDNLDVLKLLQETYLGKVKLIYIDPPYNTGNDFVYEDDFAQSKDEYLERSAQFDDQGNRLFKNTESNGRFHTDWLNMMYPRLKLAKDLLSDDGVIFISIDDNEVSNLRKIADEIFGEGNFIATLIWERAYSPKNDARFISNSHDYVLMYAKSISNFTIGRLERTEEANARYKNPDNDPRGVWKPSDMSVKTYNAQCDYPITTPSGRVIEPPTGRCWRLSKKAFLERLTDNRISFGVDGNSVPCIKRFLSELKFNGMAPQSIMFYKAVGHSQEGAKEVTALLEGGVFDGPKPLRLLVRILTLANLHKDSIVLDFFSGSATTAHAVMQLNAEDGGNRKYIMVQLPEATNEKSEAYKAGYTNICEIGKERIRRAGKKILEDNAGKEGIEDLDVGFRVLKLDSSNMKDVFYHPNDLNQEELSGLESNIKEDRTAEDLLYQVMLDLGIPLSATITEEEIAGRKVLSVDGTYLVTCFDNHVSDELVTLIAQRKPYYFVVRNASLALDSTMSNFDQIFNAYSPDTIRKIL